LKEGQRIPEKEEVQSMCRNNPDSAGDFCLQDRKSRERSVRNGKESKTNYTKK